jgi:hypothetical protein
MTATTETTTEAPAYSEADVKAARELSRGLRLLSNMCLVRPDAALLLADMFKNLINSMPSSAAVDVLTQAAAANGGTVADTTWANGTPWTGFDVRFGPVQMWVISDVPPAGAVISVEPTPELPAVAHDEVPDVEPDVESPVAAEVQDDVEVPAETVAQVTA